MDKAFKIVGSVLVAVGIFLIFGAVGSDCNGDCMEKALSISDTILYIMLGLSLSFTGGCMINYGDKYYE